MFRSVWRCRTTHILPSIRQTIKSFPVYPLHRSMATATKTYPNSVRFDLSAEQIIDRAKDIVSESKQKLVSIVSVPSNSRTFSNTVAAFAHHQGWFETQSSSCTFPSSVATEKDKRDKSNEANKLLEEYTIEVNTREDIYNAFKAYVSERQEEVNQLQPEDKRLLDKIMQSFERNGLALDAEKKKKIKEIKQRISDLCIKFQQNLNEDTTKVSFTRDELKGMSDEFIQQLEKDGERYFVSLKYPEIIPVMEKCSVEETRRKMDFANSTKCMNVNTGLFEEIIQLRQEEAQLLGFDDHAEYMLDIRMAKNSKTVFNFLQDLIEKLDAPARSQIETLLHRKKKDTGKEDTTLNAWDWRYYDQKLLQEEYQVDHDIVKEYFPLERVTEGLLYIYQTLLGLQFTQLSKEERHVWHDDVSQYVVYDKQTKKFMGHFYLDLFPRDGKYSHAAEFDLQKGFLLPSGERQYPAPAMVANFSKPTPGKPSLLTFSEVETFFHEFGHAMHELCSTSKYYRFSGTNVERDFVEAPSQMLENWCYEGEVLKVISGHYADMTKHLPDELREKIVNAKIVNEAIKLRRQLHFAMYDMLVHTAKGKVDTAALWHKCMREIALFSPQQGTNGGATFGHLTGGYSAGYYGYLWSKVYSSDMYLRFKKEGILSEKVGRQYRDLILATGGTKDSMDVLTDFLGRRPDSDAFLVEIGVKK